MLLAIFRKHVANIEQRQLQHILQILFVLFPRQSSQRPTTVCNDIGAIGFCDRIVQCFEQRLTIGIGQILRIGRHFASMNTIVNQNPTITQLPIVQRESQRSKIESAFRCVTVMTVEAGLLDQFIQWFGNVSRC